MSMRFITRHGSDRLTAEPNTSFSSSENLVVVVPYLCELQATFRHSLPKVRRDEPDKKAFDFEIVARAGRKDIVPRLVLVGFEDIDTQFAHFDHGHSTF